MSGATSVHSSSFKFSDNTARFIEYGYVAVAVRLKYGKYNRRSRLKGRLFAVSRRQRKDKKRKQKRLERVPEKLQRKRDRQERQRARRVPRWIRTGLVVVLLIVIIGAATWVGISLLPPPDEVEPSLGAVYVLQQDNFYVFINDTGYVQIEYMVGRYGGGTFLGNQPLNVSIARTFDQDQVNFTMIDPFVFYDYYGNAYYIPPTLEANGFEFLIENVHPNMQFEYEQRIFRGGSTMRGYYSLLLEYIVNSSDNLWLQTDTMEDMFTFTFDIHPDNDTFLYNTPTIIHCNITFNTLQASDTNVYNYGKSMIIFPKQVFNDSTLLANITVHDVSRIGSIVNPDQNPTINNETHIGFRANPITTSMSQNQSWGYTFDLNVTRFTNSSFCLLDLTSPQNEFFMQTGYTGIVLEQPMHFPKAQIEILTPQGSQLKKNYTNIEFSFPQIRVDNGTVYYQASPDSFGPLVPLIPLPVKEDTPLVSESPLEGISTDSSTLNLQMLPFISALRRFFLVK